MNSLDIKVNYENIKGFAIKKSQLLSKNNISPVAERALNENFTALLELSRNNPRAFEELTGSKNAQTTALTVAHNSMLGGVINKDFWLVSYGATIVEVKTGQFWRSLAYQFSKKPIKQIIVQIIKEGDELSMGEFPAKIINYKPNINGNANDWDSILACYGEIRYDDGSYQTRLVTKEELTNIREKSPSKNSDYSPWKLFPGKIIESKVLRELVTREVVLDNEKIAEFQYGTLMKDEQPLESWGDELHAVESKPKSKHKIDLDDQLYDVLEKVEGEKKPQEDLNECNR